MKLDETGSKHRKRQCNAFRRVETKIVDLLELKQMICTQHSKKPFLRLPVRCFGTGPLSGAIHGSHRGAPDMRSLSQFFDSVHCVHCVHGTSQSYAIFPESS